VVLTGAADENRRCRRHPYTACRTILLKGLPAAQPLLASYGMPIERKQATARVQQLNTELERRVKTKSRSQTRRFRNPELPHLNLMEDAVEARKLAEQKQALSSNTRRGRSAGAWDLSLLRYISRSKR